MSGDVQPRKRKDKKKKKDELGVEEPRGTAAALGEGDVFLHSHQDHGTGGHWCAKIIFFSLLAVLITLIGLIILENRGLSELEANAVESRYSGVLDGWLEDATDDDHHDAHTLELKHHDDDDEEHGHDDEHQFDHEDDEDHDEDEEHDDDFDHNEDDEQTDDDENEEHTRDDDDDDEDDDQEDQEDEERDDPDIDDNDEDGLQDEDSNVEAADEEEGGVGSFRKYFGFGYGNDKDEEISETKSEEEHGSEEEHDEEEIENTVTNELNNDDDDENDEDEDNDDENKLNEEDDLSKENAYDNSFENFDDDGNKENDDDDNTLNDFSEKDEDDHDEHEDDDDDDGDEDTEVERIEREVSQEEQISTELPALPEDEDDDKDQDQEDADDEKSQDDNDDDDDVDPDDGDEEDDFLEADDESPIERITAPSGRPFDELEEDVSSEKPPDTLKEEEEYEKKQEELRQEQEQSSHMWLKLVVGVALLAATHTVVRRATAPPDETESDEHISREETPVVDRRMTLISVPEEPVEPEVKQKASKPVEEVVEKTSSAVKYAPLRKEISEEEEDQEDEEVEMEEQEKDDEKELFSEEEPEDEPEQEDEIVQARKEKLQQVVPTVHEPTPDDEVDDDVEIIDDDRLEEELEDEEDDDEISDVDDAELLTRLEAKYGRLPEPDRPAPKHKDGGNSLEDEWAGEPSDSFWRQQLDSAERDLRQGEYSAAMRVARAPALAGSARAAWLLARALDAEAEARRDNRVLSRAIAAYIDLLKMNERLSDEKLLMIANRTLERIQFRGNYLSAEPVYRLLIRRFPDDVTYRNKLTVSYLMANRPDLADETLKQTLRIWPNDRVALAHYGFVLKTQHNKLEEAVIAFQKALEGDQGPACEPRFYYHLGDAFLLLGRYAEAHEVHKRGAKLGHFLSPAQRSLYNVPRLRGKPWWNVEDTPYVKLARVLEQSWREILKEGLAAQALYEKEKEGLKERGEWSQLDLFVRGQEIPGRCKQAPVTCSVVKTEAAAAGCRRGQIKFSAMAPGTHVRPHVGPTNCRLRMHLGLSNTKDTYLRVEKETRQWQEGKVLLFDDSFEHEVWHNGTGKRLVLIVDLWHPDLTPAERRQLPAI